MTAPATRRCAVYTRKSTEEGLEQAFNSLDAQREACAAYITSQRHEGWTMLADLYDDGGYSGGSMLRPGLQQLLTDIKANRIDVIVVYKVDRLTRSLADFAKMVELFDEHSVSFVSVTQAFNTTNSMGRLTLNVLLSFAQFEREVTGERIRDKIAASKARGIWMGGGIPLGYDPHERKLVVNASEAAIVRHMFERYLDLGSVRGLADDLFAEGVRSKAWVSRKGLAHGGTVMHPGAVAHILQNPLYAGHIQHKGKLHAGDHVPIIEQELFDRVQARLASQRRVHRRREHAAEASLLAGRLNDPEGRPMTPSHAVKDGRRYRYYITRRDVGAAPSQVWRVPAGEIEPLVIRALGNWLSAEAPKLIAADATGDAFAAHLAVVRTMQQLADGSAPHDHRQLIEALLDGVQITETEIALSLRSGTFGIASAAARLTIPGCIAKRGQELCLEVSPGDARPALLDATLIRLVAKAWAARTAMLRCRGLSFDAVAAELGHTPAHVRRLLRLGYLAPDILAAIINGRQPKALTARTLLRANGIPNDWAAQRRMFGFAAA